MSGRTVELDHVPAPRARWGGTTTPPPGLLSIIEAGRDAYAQRLERFLSYTDDLRHIARDPVEGSLEAAWVTWYFGGLDAVALYAFIRSSQPARYVEIGSGMSTRIARRAIADGGLHTEIVSIDPDPRSDVDPICDRRILQPLEEVDLAFFDEVEAGDIVFLDGSHRVLTNSDVLVFFFEVLPRLPAGTLVQVHDVFLPYDYPEEWADRYYSEQYLLAAWLLGGGQGMEVLFPGCYVNNDPELFASTTELWKAIPLQAADYVGVGCSFWFRITERRPVRRRWSRWR